MRFSILLLEDMNNRRGLSDETQKRGLKADRAKGADA